ncbi:MAG: hypothetical protein V4702_02540 [Patescibacteria group bacterium]
MRAHTFNDQWHTIWPNTSPIAEDLRKQLKYWVRMHMLPDAKRYPDTDEELQMVISRHTRLLNALGSKDYLYIVTANWTDAAIVSSKHNPGFVHEGYSNELWLTLDEDVDVFRHLYIGQSAWPSEVFSDLLSQVADDKLAGVIIAPPNVSWLYLPYDGGVDIITPLESQHDKIVNDFSEWLAPEWSEPKLFRM